MKPRNSTQSEAARALGKDRKQLQRWRAVTGAPFDSDGRVNIEELRAWAESTGRLTREARRPTEVDRLTSEMPEVVKADHSRALQPNPESVLDELSAADREALEALVAGDAAALIDLAARVGPGLLKKLALMGRTRRELAEAERREIENKSRRNELVEKEEMARFWVGQINLVKSRFQSVPGKLAAKLAGKGYDEVYQALEEELHSILEGFAVEVPA